MELIITDGVLFLFSDNRLDLTLRIECCTVSEMTMILSKISFAIARVDQGVICNDDVVAFNSGDFFRCKKLSSIFCRKFMS